MLNGDDPFLRKAVLPDHVRPVWFSLGDENADVCALSIQQDEKGMSFVLEDHEEGTFLVKIPAMGRHNVANALAAYCAATRLGCDAKRVIHGLSNFEQTAGSLPVWRTLSRPECARRWCTPEAWMSLRIVTTPTPTA